MTAAWNRYENFTLSWRLILILSAAIVLNAIYCLAYTYAAGHPSTIAEAFAWGTINLAPWLAAIEIGRHRRRIGSVALLLGAAGLLSLMLESAITASLPGSLDLVRRIPGALVASLALICFALFRKFRSQGSAAASSLVDLECVTRCNWVRSAGNYVEIHEPNSKPRLVRSSLASCITAQRLGLIRIHRSYAVARDSIENVERAHVRLKDGKRLPIGDRYRDSLIPFE